MATKYRVLLRSMKINYVIDHRMSEKFLFPYIVSILREFIILRCGYAKRIILYKGAVYDLLLCIFFVVNDSTSTPRHHPISYRSRK
jgi:hypothetical protein